MNNAERFQESAERFGKETTARGRVLTPEEEAKAIEIRDRSINNVHTVVRSLKDYLEMFDTNRIDQHPSFQREFCWTKKQCSFLIETILLNGHIGTIILTQDCDGRLVVDGRVKLRVKELTDAQQRTTAMWLFRHDKYRLCGLEKLHMLNGCKFSNLPQELQDAFLSAQLTCLEYTNIDKKDKLDIYNRTNSGKPLTKMEKQIATGDQDFIAMVDEISNDKNVKALFERSAGYFTNRGKIRDNFIKKYVIRTYLPDVNQKEDLIVVRFKDYFSGDIEKLKKDVLKTFKMANNIIGDIAFFPYYKTTLCGGANVVDGFGFGVLRFFKEHLNHEECITRCSDQLREVAFPRAVERYKTEFGGMGNRQKSKASTEMVIEEFNKIAEPYIERRYFSRNDVKQLWDSTENHVCAICGNQILNIEDAEADHITPFSKGGHTTADNMQLTHSICNKTKGANIENNTTNKE